MGIRSKRTDMMVGLFAFFGLAIMAALILQFGGFRDRIRPKYEVRVSFLDGSGIFPGAPVRLGGRKVGFVADEPLPTEDFQSVIIPLFIFSDVRIPDKSRISLATAGLMGDTYIKIESPTTGPLTFIDPESTAVIEGYTAAGLAQLQESAAEISVEAKQALIDIRGAIQDIRNSVAGLDRSFTKIDTGLLSEENLGNIRTTLADLKSTGDNLKTASGKIDNLLEEGKGALTEAKSTFAKAGDAATKAKDVITKAEPAIDDIRSAIKSVNTTMDKITKGNGVAAALINDSSLKRDLENLISNLTRHGILRYKNDAEKEEEKKPGTSSTARGTKPGGWLGRH